MRNVGSVPYGHESITSYEVGAKNRFLNGQLQLNISAFLYDYKDQQISQMPDGFTAIFDAGKSRIWGVKAEALAKPGPRDQFDANADYLNARFTDLLASGVQYAGNAPPQSPSWQIGVG